MESTIVYLVMAVAAAGVYCLAPRSSRSLSMAGGIIGAAGLAMLLAYLAVRLDEGSGEAVGGGFWVLATVALAAAARVVTHPKPVYSALYFVLVVLSVAGLLLQLSAEFVAVALVIIYAGAILVTYIFVIMLAQQSSATLYDRAAREPMGAVLAGFALAAVVAGQLATDDMNATLEATPIARLAAAAEPASAASSDSAGNTRAVGAIVMTDYVVVLEIAGVLLLVAMVGAVVLARRPLPHDATRTPGPPPGTTGREVEPF